MCRLGCGTWPADGRSGASGGSAWQGAESPETCVASSWSRLVAAPAVAEMPFLLFVVSMKWEGRRLSSKGVTSMVSR